MKTPLGTEVDLDAGHIVLDGFPALRERGTAPPPLLGPCLLWSPISATAELLFYHPTGKAETTYYARDALRTVVKIHSRYTRLYVHRSGCRERSLINNCLRWDSNMDSHTAVKHVATIDHSDLTYKSTCTHTDENTKVYALLGQNLPLPNFIKNFSMTYWTIPFS